MDLLDRHGVKYVQGHNDALYVEANARWLCLWREASGLRCYVWPDGAPRPTGFGSWTGRKEQLLGVDTRDHSFDIEAHLEAGEIASVTLGHVKCAPEPQQAFAYTMPPSRRPKSRARRCDRALLSTRPRLAATTDATPLEAARAFAAARAGTFNQGLLVASVEHAGASVVSIGAGGSGDYSEMWTCLRGPGASRACGSTALSQFEPLDSGAPVPGAWLLLAYEPAYRSGSSEIVWLTARDGRLTTATLDVGGTDAIGEGCEHLPSYCVDIVGNWTRWKVLSTTCVRIGPTVRWRAVHVRAQHRWVNEKLLPPARPEPARSDADSDADADGDWDSHEEGPGVAPTPGTYRPVMDHWEPADCAPTASHHSIPACRQADAHGPSSEKAVAALSDRPCTGRVTSPAPSSSATSGARNGP
jgi:hypothetical protein